MSVLRHPKVKNPMSLHACKARRLLRAQIAFSQVGHCNEVSWLGAHSYYFSAGKRHSPSNRVLSEPFLQMVETASLRVVSSRRVEIPFGKYCDSCIGIDGSSLSKYKAVSVENYVQLLNMISKFMMKNGGIELANGIVISNEVERQVLMGELARFINEGGHMFISEWVIERPFEP